MTSSGRTTPSGTGLTDPRCHPTLRRPIPPSANEKASFMFSLSWMATCLLRVLMTRPMTVRLSFALFRLCEWFPLAWQKCLKMCGRLLPLTFELPLLILTRTPLSTLWKRMCARLFLPLQWTEPTTRPITIRLTQRPLVSI